ncbi:MAG: heme A synthase [Flavobacteriaceae bacterium]|nr:heme A synthase [Flavobacteriaceae bacterium]|tara:strand:- start:12 stop:1013 length:1002 start_codon:yes stop_codon:yes gene_type:complete
MENSFIKSVKFSLIIVYLVITAGAIVRMTGSGMGCPDWPKCFGYWIPPTERTELDWKPNHLYLKGQVIILDEELRVAKSDFNSRFDYNQKNWGFYTQHDYALFNPYHTWIEYLNRLLGALAGLAVLIMTVQSFLLKKKKKITPIISFLILMAMVFQAWLGKTVVDSNLLPYRITIHMVMALLIVLGLIILLFISQRKITPIPASQLMKILAIFSVVLTLFQIGLGTQVRQFVDLKMHLQVSQWLDPAPLKFYFHRSLSLIVLAVHLTLFWMFRKINLNLRLFNQILGLIGLEIFTGILMFYLDFPFSSQPLHLIIAALLFGAQSLFIFRIIVK